MSYELKRQVEDLLTSRKQDISNALVACVLLNEAGIRRPAGGEWTPQALRHALWNWGISLQSLKTAAKAERRAEEDATRRCTSFDEAVDAVPHCAQEVRNKVALTRVRVRAFLMTWHGGRRKNREVLADLNHKGRVYKQKRETGDRDAKLNVTYQQIATSLNAAGIQPAGSRKHWTAEGFYNYLMRHNISLDPVLDTEGLLVNERNPTIMQTLMFIDFANIPTEPYADRDPHDEWPEDFLPTEDELLPHDTPLAIYVRARTGARS